jgi:serine/threonine protein kinase
MDYTGQKIEKYLVKRLIGEGGMASVYEAEHEVLGTKAAIKILNPVLTANADIRERFMNEAKMMASFQHTNITKIIDFEESDTFLAIIMEYLEGQDLSELIDSGAKLSDKEISNIFKQTLSAFQYAHEKGVIHRDIKPSNIYILPNGKVKVLDFGIAKLFGQGNEKTQAGTQMGTPIYMSPEQVKADKSIDHRSDIYSLGVTLYFALNGKSPYDSDGASQFDIFNKIVYEPLPELAGESPLIALVKKACQKDRDQRYQSCEEWLEDLIAIQTSSSTVGQIPPLKPEESVHEKTKIEEQVQTPLAGIVEPPKKKSNILIPIIFISLGVIIILIIIGSLSKEDRSGIETVASDNSVQQIPDNTTSNDSIKEEKLPAVAPKDNEKSAFDKSMPLWFNTSQNKIISVNGKIIKVADSPYPTIMSYKRIKQVLINGWRLPTKVELEAMYRKNYLNGKGWKYYLCLSNNKLDFAHYGMFFPRGEWVINHAYFENPYWDETEPSCSYFVKD